MLTLSPDGRRYLSRAPLPSPFHRRWLLPALLARHPRAWACLTWASLAATVALMAAYVPSHPVAAAWLFATLPIAAINARLPALTDAPAMALALGAAVAWQRGLHGLAVALSLVSGACKESGPVFAAVYAGAPWLLLGLAAVRWAGAVPPGPSDAYLGPLGAVAGRIRRERLHPWRHVGHTLLPWGALAVLAPWGAGWDRVTALALLALAVGYGQLVIATDNARLAQWAAPCVIALAVRAPEAAVAIGCVWSVCNPYEGV